VMVRSLLAPSEQENSVGRLGRFEVLGIVGSGGMGIVLKCRDVDIDRVVAIKIPSAQLWRSKRALEVLEREARSAASVLHPHVIAIYQVDRWRDVPYLVMPYFPGPSLDRRIHAAGPLSLFEAVRIARQMAEALAAAHARGVIHRDVKPGNILLGRGVERAVLSDFGLAKVQSDATMTASGLLAGTPSYLSPEQATGAAVTPASDLFSLGSVLRTMLSGEAPWAGLHPHAIVHRIASAEMPPLAAPRNPPPAWVNRLLDWMQHPDPRGRPESAASLAECLRACERHLSEPAAQPLPTELAADEARSPKRKRFWLAAGCLAAVVALTSLSGLALFPSSHSLPRQAESPAPPAADPTGDSRDRNDEHRADRDRPVASESPHPVAKSEPGQSPSTVPDISPATLDAMLDEIEASTRQLLSELQSLEEPQP